MKTMRKIFAMALVLMLVMSLATTAFAAEATYTLTLNGAMEGHTYTAYQIFDGDLSDSTLSNIVWGSGVTAEGQAALGNAATKAESLKTTADAEAFAAAVAPYLGAAAGSVTIADGATSGTITNLDAGYYLVKTTAATEQNGVYTYYIMKVVKNTNATIKADAPEVKKEVNKTDINIGDTVTFTLTATMPSTFEGYDSYKVVFHDTMYKGLTYNGDASASVDGFIATTGTDTNGNTTITITNADVLDDGVTAGSTITVTYTATLNSDAIIGTAGNSNKVKLEYSNDPNWNGTGNEPTGDTPEKEVKVYTWDMGVLKYADGDESKVLAGVKFILLNQTKTKIANVADGKIVSWDDFTEETVIADYELITDKDGIIHIDGLESGSYFLRETQELPGYNKLPADVTVTVDNNADGKYETYIAKVENNSGATLPETGGMGTTLFYVFGAIMMVGAAILLVTKKRMASAE